MSQHYIAYIDGAETTAMNFDELKFFALSKALPNDTPVRLNDSATWLTWGEIPALQLNTPAPGNTTVRSIIQNSSSLVASRIELRARTAYPFLRSFGSVMIGISIADALILWGVVIFFSDPTSVTLLAVIASGATLCIPPRHLRQRPRPSPPRPRRHRDHPRLAISSRLHGSRRCP